MKVYKTLLADPPWKLSSGGSKTLSPMYKYPVQAKDEVIETMLNWANKYIIAPEAHMYLWCVNSYSAGYSRGILDAVDVCHALGFKPITNILWTKPQSNPTPYGQRGSEICIFATRYRKGRGPEVMYKGTDNPECVAQPTLTKSIDWLHASRREHSRKPDEFYDMIMKRSKGPYLEMYSRTTYPGWDVVGNQVNKFKI